MGGTGDLYGNRNVSLHCTQMNARELGAQAKIAYPLMASLVDAVLGPALAAADDISALTHFACSTGTYTPRTCC